MQKIDKILEEKKEYFNLLKKYRKVFSPRLLNNLIKLTKSPYELKQILTYENLEDFLTWQNEAIVNKLLELDGIITSC